MDEQLVVNYGLDLMAESSLGKTFLLDVNFLNDALKLSIILVV